MLNPCLICFTLALAQNPDSPIDIGDIGSERIGGPGLTPTPTTPSSENDEDWVTEETLPPPGHKKRLFALQVLAGQYASGKMWKDACDKYELILSESTAEMLDPVGRQNAARSFFECAKIDMATGDHSKVETLLTQSESLGQKTAKHEHLRRQLIKARYREKLEKGDMASALQLYQQYQQPNIDEDERIWLGEQLAARAQNAYENKESVLLNDYLQKLETIAPMNSEYRALKEEITSKTRIFGNLITSIGGLVLLLLILRVLLQWNAKRKVRAEPEDEFEATEQTPVH